MVRAEDSKNQTLRKSTNNESNTVIQVHLAVASPRQIKKAAQTAPSKSNSTKVERTPKTTQIKKIQNPYINQ